SVTAPIHAHQAELLPQPRDLRIPHFEVQSPAVQEYDRRTCALVSEAQSRVFHHEVLVYWVRRQIPRCARDQHKPEIRIAKNFSHSGYGLTRRSSSVPAPEARSVRSKTARERWRGPQKSAGSLAATSLTVRAPASSWLCGANDSMSGGLRPHDRRGQELGRRAR